MLRVVRCRRCNYDLTDNVSGVCPECGKSCAADAGPAANEGRAARNRFEAINSD